MAGLENALPYASAAISMGSILGQGEAAEDVGKIRSRQLKRQAISDKAQAVQEAKQEKKKAELLQSRVKALAASSGTSIASPDIQNTLSDIDEQGEYNALAALYSGFSSASSKDYASSVSKFEGKQKRRGSALKATGTILDTLSKEYG